MNIYGASKYLHRALPQFMREFIESRSVLVHIKNWLQNSTIRYATHDEIYDKKYYLEVVDPPAVRSAATVGATINEKLHPSTVIDLGCGTGALIRCLAQLGIRCVGLEYAELGVGICKDRGLDVHKFDVTRDTLPVSEVFDLAISIEVAEHLPEESADRFVSTLCSLADQVILTAAGPTETSPYHLNCQPKQYWVEKFFSAGFILDGDLVEEFRREWTGTCVQHWYWRNLMVFRKA